MRKVRTLTCLLLVFAFATGASAQDYPNKPITWVVPFTPAGQADTAARMLAKTAGEKLGQQIVIENKPGAGGIVGAEIVMNAKPDGYTIFYGSSGPMGILPKLHKNISYDPVKSFVPIAAIAVSPLVLMVAPGKPYKTFKEFVDYARQNPNKLQGLGACGHRSARRADRRGV
jgi:tripartite-type tricarboxylate transporter receptor subunit TctC